MFVPRSRLLLWVALLVVPFAALVGLAPEAAAVSIAIIVLFATVVVLDAVLSIGRLGGIHIDCAPVTRLSKDRPGGLELLFKNESGKEVLLRLGLQFPPELETEKEDLLVALPSKAEVSRIAWPCIPRKRGNFRVSQCFVESASPLGFWAVRSVKTIAAEVRVYPNLATERKSVAAVFLNRGNFGAHALRQVGKGRDFEKLREYVAGDSYDEIHWKATAKRGKPVTKVFQIERTQEVYVIIDASRLSARAVPGTDNASNTYLEKFISSALVLGMAAEQQGDLFGLLTFSDRVQSFVRAKNGKAHYAACRDAIYTLQPQIVTPDFDDLASFIRLRLRRRALLIVLTSLDDPVLAESFLRSMDLISRQHLILVNMMQPPGAKPVFSSSQVDKVDGIYQHLGGHLQWHNLRELGKVLQRRGVGFSLVENERLTGELVRQYVSVKQRQLL